LIFWIDAQLPPSLAPWLVERFEVEAESLRRLGLRDAEDESIFDQARRADAIIVTKDADFIRLLERRGPPPSVVWITLGNTSNARLRTVFDSAFPAALSHLLAGEPLVEISDASVRRR